MDEAPPRTAWHVGVRLMAQACVLYPDPPSREFSADALRRCVPGTALAWYGRAGHAGPTFSANRRSLAGHLPRPRLRGL